MSEYVIESPHTKEECLATLDEMAKGGRAVLDKFEWGCIAGDHTAYGIVQASNEVAARNLVPANVRGKATVHEVKRFTPEEIRQMHRG